MKINGDLVLSQSGVREVKNAIIDKRSGHPSPAVAGRLYFNTTDNTYYYYTGATWSAFTSQSALADFYTKTELDAGQLDNRYYTETEMDVALGLKQPLDATLTALAGLNTTGGVVAQTGTDTFTKRTITGTTNQIVVTNGDGVLNNPTLSLAAAVTTSLGLANSSIQPGDNVSSLTNDSGFGTVSSVDVTSASTGLSVTGSPITTSGSITIELNDDLTSLSEQVSEGFAARTLTGSPETASWVLREVQGVSGRVVVSNGDGISGNPVIDLDTLANGGTGSFVKISRDNYGRVSGTTAVTTSDITALVGSTYVDVTGDTMSGNLNMGNNRIVGLADPVDGTDAVNKNYLDAAVTGLTWKDAVRVATIGPVDLSTDLESGDNLDGITLSTGDRVLVKDQALGSPPAPEENGIYIVQGSGAAVRAGDMDNPAEFYGATVFVQEGASAGSGWTQTEIVDTVDSDPVTFVQFTGAGTYTAGVGLTLGGNSFSVNLGAGIAALPTDEVGIELQDTTDGALILTTDGTTRSTLTSSKLYLLLDGSGGLEQTSSGLRIGAGAVTNSMLANPSTSIVSSSGSTSFTLGTTFNLLGTSNRLSSTATSNTVTFDISTSYVGQTSITTLGTVTTGTWQGTTVAAGYGGTGITSVGDSGNVLRSTGSAWASSPMHYVYDSELLGSPSELTVHTITHNLGQRFVTVTVYSHDTIPEQILPESVTLDSSNAITVTFNVPVACYVVITGVAGVSPGDGL